jgi:hypothetical protein
MGVEPKTVKTLRNRLDEIEDTLANYSNDIDVLEDTFEELKLLSSVDPEEDERILILLKQCEDAITDLVISTNLIDL